MGYHRVNLKQLLKIGTEALSTTAQTLSSAVNELKSALTSVQTTADNALTTAHAADSLADDAYVRAGLLEPPMGAAGIYIVGHATSEILAHFGTSTADADGLKVTYNGGCKCWAFGNGTNTSAVTKTLFEVSLQSGQRYYASFKDPSNGLYDLNFNIRNMNAAGSPIIASFTSASPSGTFTAPAVSGGVLRARVEVVFTARFSHSGPPITFLPILTTPHDFSSNPTLLLSNYYNSAGDAEPASLPGLREAVGGLKTQLAALSNPATFAPAGTPFKFLATVTMHQHPNSSMWLLMIDCFVQNPALMAIMRKSSFQVVEVQVSRFDSSQNQTTLVTGTIVSSEYADAFHDLSLIISVSQADYNAITDGAAALLTLQW